MNSSSRPVVLSRKKDKLECDVAAIPDWEGFDKIVRFLEKHYDAEVVSRADGPDARRWVLRAMGQIIEVQHDDPWGNTIVSPTPEADPIVERIASDLGRRFSKV